MFVVMIGKPSHHNSRSGRITVTKKDSLIATLGPSHDRPWWWKHIDSDHANCKLDYERLTFRSKYSQEISTLEIPLVMLKILRRLIQWRRRYTYVFSFECDLVGFSIAFWQTIAFMKQPRHVILQFIMREKEDTFRSRFKYQFMRFIFSSVHRVVVSSTNEIEYYKSVFRWHQEKLVFVPFHTAPELLKRQSGSDEDYLLAAGRTFRDFETLLEAVAGAGTRLVLVGGTGAVERYSGLYNVQVLENIPVADLEALVLKARAVVVPLQDRPISIGQSVILQAMALGKPVIATRTAGTADYIKDMVDGILVNPYDALDLRRAIGMLRDESVRQMLGRNARKRVTAAFLPEHYAAAVRAALCD